MFSGLSSYPLASITPVAMAPWVSWTWRRPTSARASSKPFSREGALERHPRRGRSLRMRSRSGGRRDGRTRATRVVGVDCWRSGSRKRRRSPSSTGWRIRWTFAREWHEPVDLIARLDSFEHFADPAARSWPSCRRLLRPGGRVLGLFWACTGITCLAATSTRGLPDSHLLFPDARSSVGDRSIRRTERKPSRKVD